MSSRLSTPATMAYSRHDTSKADAARYESVGRRGRQARDSSASRAGARTARQEPRCRRSWTLGRTERRSRAQDKTIQGQTLRNRPQSRERALAEIPEEQVSGEKSILPS